MQSVRFWVLCLPYAVGYFFIYLLAYSAMKYLAAIAFVAAMQARMYVDTLLGIFVLSIPSSTIQMVTVTMILTCTLVHLGTVPAGNASPDPAYGTLLAAIYDIVSSATYTYMPWLLNKYKYDMAAVGFATSLEQVVGGIIAFWVYYGDLAIFFNGFEHYQSWFLVLSSFMLDTASFLAVKHLTPLTITVLAVLQIPVVFAFEILYFEMTPGYLPIASAVSVLMSVILFVSVKRDLMTRQQVLDTTSNNMSNICPTHNKMPTSHPPCAWMEES